MSQTGGAEPIHSESAKVEPIEPGQASNVKPTPAPPAPVSNRVLREIMSSGALLTVLAIVLALVVAGVLIVVTDPDVQATAGYFFARPGDTFAAIGQSIAGAYSSMFRGAIWDYGATNPVSAITFLNSLSFATPLILAGLGVALSFRVGLFNIGGQGQLLVAAAAAGWIGWSFPMPPVVAFLVATIGAIVAGGIWGGIVGVLKARTGAHEVIVTIMLNYVAVNLLAFALSTQGLLQGSNPGLPQGATLYPNAQYPHISDLFAAFGIASPTLGLNVGFLIAIIATVAVWYLFNRSATGFRFRAVGENPSAARVAGINVKWVYVLAMILAGAFVGLAGAVQLLGDPGHRPLTGDIDAGLGFNAITVALLGRSRPWGVFLSGLLFGALRAGGYRMQGDEGIPLDLVLVIQSIIVLFLAAPPLVRAVFRLPAPGSTPTPRSTSGRRGQRAAAEKPQPLAEGASR